MTTLARLLEAEAQLAKAKADGRYLPEARAIVRRLRLLVKWEASQTASQPPHGTVSGAR